MSLSQRVKSLSRLHRMSALRQAVFLTAVFLLLLLVAGGVAVSEFYRQFENRIEDELLTRFTVVADDIEDRGYDPFTYPQTETERIIWLEQTSLRPGFYDDLEFRWDNDRRAFGRGQWMYLVGHVDGGELIVGTNLGRRDDFVEVILGALGFVGLAAAFVALAFGLFLGLRTQKRMDSISQTLKDAASGDLGARVGIVKDRDDLDELAHQVDDTIAQLDVLMRQTRDFSANIAHDLKTPLARLRIRLETALTAEIDEGDSADQIGAALEHADKVIAIFDAFLRIAKLESGATRANFEAVDLGELVREIADIYDVVVEDSGRTLSLNIDAPETVQGDRVLLIQMLANMIENAMRHTPQGSEMRLIAKGTALGLADNGPGIPADEREKVLQPLYRLEKSRTTEGAGLGLSLVKTISDLHGAELELADNTPGLIIRANFSNLTNL